MRNTSKKKEQPELN